MDDSKEKEITIKVSQSTISTLKTVLILVAVVALAAIGYFIGRSHNSATSASPLPQAAVQPAASATATASPKASDSEQQTVVANNLPAQGVAPNAAGVDLGPGVEIIAPADTSLDAVNMDAEFFIKEEPVWDLIVDSKKQYIAVNTIRRMNKKPANVDTMRALVTAVGSGDDYYSIDDVSRFTDITAREARAAGATQVITLIEAKCGDKNVEEVRALRSIALRESDGAIAIQKGPSPTYRYANNDAALKNSMTRYGNALCLQHQWRN